MASKLQLGEVTISVTRKSVKRSYLSVHPPYGDVTLVAPKGVRSEVVRAFAISKLRWIRERQERFKTQAREGIPELVERESLTLWGRRYLLSIGYRDSKPGVEKSHRRIILYVRPGADLAKRSEVMKEWHHSLLNQAIPTLVAKWEKHLGVNLNGFSLQRMKTKWGSCNPKARTIRLNSQLVTKPKDLLDYVIVHEMAHLIEPSHNDRFFAILDMHYPSWRDARMELNALPLAAEHW